MAYASPSKKSLANLKPPKKGDPARNPTGKNNPHIREMHRLTRDQIAEIGSLILNGDEDALEEYCEGIGVSMLHKLIGRVLRRASNRGDHKAMVALIEQIAGKQVQEVKVQMSAHASLVKLISGAEEEK